MSDKIDEMKEMLDTGEILPFHRVKFYQGTFTGKMVKASNNKNDFKDFVKGDEVLVFNMKEFSKFYKGIEMILELIREINNK